MTDDRFESAVQRAIGLFAEAHDRCINCNKTRYEHRDHSHEPGVCVFGDCDRFVKREGP